MNRHPLCITVHVERLHDAKTWAEMIRFLGWLKRNEACATFFVQPLPALVQGSEFRDRLITLGRDGHEIGQHTHYYEDVDTIGPGKRPAVTADEVRRCLELDHAALVDRGVRPRGFIAGGWNLRDEAFDWLVSRGFAYDCSFRAFTLRYPNPSSAPGTRQLPFRYRGVVEIPTTSTLTIALRRAALRTPGAAFGGLSYEIVYLHDYDLLDVRRWIVLSVLGFLYRRAEKVTVGSLLPEVTRRLSIGDEWETSADREVR